MIEAESHIYVRWMDSSINITGNCINTLCRKCKTHPEVKPPIYIRDLITFHVSKSSLSLQLYIDLQAQFEQQFDHSAYAFLEFAKWFMLLTPTKRARAQVIQQNVNGSIVRQAEVS
jgi:hypothetical protein